MCQLSVDRYTFTPTASLMSCCWTHSWAGVFEIFCARHETATAVVQRHVGLRTKLAAYRDRENITVVRALTAKKKDYCSMPSSR